ncbi:hypothetical protein COLO4_04300 [Corchorus olitorius]|uniref:Uncharacterized protein n=1 Tax=Corchorus olitorius TaxID=93759 RepID=A0A1R3KUH1_9ROSI|nr:hypothetical protein COLO4_04300 [Corchorus olitorius]
MRRLKRLCVKKCVVQRENGGRLWREKFQSVKVRVRASSCVRIPVKVPPQNERFFGAVFILLAIGDAKRFLTERMGSSTSIMEADEGERVGE